jgi:cyanophycinase
LETGILFLFLGVGVEVRLFGRMALKPKLSTPAFIMGKLLRYLLLILLISSFVPAGLFAQGKLFLIGGGERPPGLLDRMLLESGIRGGGYVVILPMASANPDSAVFLARRQFVENGVQQVAGMYFTTGVAASPARLDSLRNARLIFLPGGDQNRFMEAVRGTPIQIAIQEAYARGALIAGTSAGAAVMSQKMITGTELRHPPVPEEGQEVSFRSIEAANIELDAGLGLLPRTIIDQHFIRRKRMNRLTSVAIENPGVWCLGIDEATALLVHRNQAEVVGQSQVVAIRSRTRKPRTQNGLLGSKKMQMRVYLPGDRFSLR